MQGRRVPKAEDTDAARAAQRSGWDTDEANASGEDREMLPKMSDVMNGQEMSELTAPQTIKRGERRRYLPESATSAAGRMTETAMSAAGMVLCLPLSTDIGIII